MKYVDLNCDMGEGCGNDADLMNYVSSVNVACGFHAGDAATMRRTVDTAVEKNVAIGAHPGYPDKNNFGRIAMDMSLMDVKEIVAEQILALRDVCIDAGAKLTHVKPHGALYNESAKDPDLAVAIAEAVHAVDQKLILYGLAGSYSVRMARKIGLRAASEAFADRTYQPDGSLTARTLPHALIAETSSAQCQVLQMVERGSVTAVTGVAVPIEAQTVCIHGDGEHALEFARVIYHTLIDHGIEVQPV
ncbi:MAG: 5-oxoprolinase subunit PxpA [Pyrinomonadaceae bacterium]